MVTPEYICDVTLDSALDWQRSKADIPKQLVGNEQAWLEENHCQFWADWQRDVFRLSTANEFGLSIWSIILDESIYGYTAESPQDYPSLGFGLDDENFFDGSFAADDAYTYEFTIEEKRILLQLKAFKVLSMGGPIIQINKAMANIFGAGVIIASDTLRMEFIYQVNDQAIINFIREIRNRDLLPRPIGVGASDVRIKASGAFGFAEDDENFFGGNFYDGSI